MSTLDSQRDRDPLTATGTEAALVVVSADTARGLDAATTDLARRLRRLPSGELADAAYTLAISRRARAHRRAVLCTNPEKAARQLADASSDGDGTRRPLVFALPAVIPDAARLATDAITTDPRFARYHRACRRAGALKHGDAGAVFAYAYATARLWQHWGLQPDALHAAGVGQAVAACLGGTLSLADAIALLGSASPGQQEPTAPRRRRTPRFPVEPFGTRTDAVILTPGAEGPLHTLRRAWLAGADIDWQSVYEGQDRRRVRLPGQSDETRRNDAAEPPRHNETEADQDRAAEVREGGGDSRTEAHREPAAEPREGDTGELPTVPWALAAGSAGALRQRAAEVKAAVEAQPGRSAPDIARSLAAEAADVAPAGHRAVVVGGDRADLLRGLTALAAGRPAPGVVRGAASVTDSRLVFVFPGQGAQWRGMAADLMESSPAFRAEADRCAEAFAPHLGWSLTDVLRDRPGAAPLERTDVVQPVLFTVSAALHALLDSWGVRPAAVLGHSLGEMVAAYVSGALSLADAAVVCACMSKAQAALSGTGAMASVELPLDAVRERLADYGGRVGLASVNGVEWAVVSGDRDDVARLVAELTADGVRARTVNVDLAAHSAHLEAVRDRMLRDLAPITPRPVRLPMRSSMTGEPLTGTELNNAYWYGNLRHTVEFARTVGAMVDDGYRAFVEVSPHPALTMGVSGVLEAAGAETESIVVGTLRRGQDGRGALLSAVAELYVRGLPVDWTAVFDGSRPAAGPVGRADTQARAARRDALEDAGQADAGASPTRADSAGAAAPDAAPAIMATHEPTAPANPGDAAPPADPDEPGDGLRARLAGLPRSAAEREVLELVAAHTAALLGVDSLHEVTPDWASASLGTLGFTSLLAVELRGKLAQETGLRLARTLVFDHPTPQGLARFLAGELLGAASEERPARPERSTAESGGNETVAIVGMAAQLPGAADLDAYWDLLSTGSEAISQFTDEQLAAAGVPQELIRDPRYVKAFGAMPEAELFDAAFFGMTPAEAEVTDPQQRLFLHACHTALEHAGYDPARHPGAIGVFGGSANNTYLQDNVLTGTDRTATSDYFRVLVGNDKDYLATRVAYKLNLKGPGCTVQTACSTSLVALHLACQALRAGDCDLALAGGVSVRTPQTKGHLYEEGSILSADGHVRVFDAAASGTVFGSGVGVLALKRLSDAVVDGDTIHAVVLGTATNNDGAEKVSYAAPARDGQAAVIARAQEAAGIDAGSISYLEAHGTGTRLGDPVEVSALDQAFRRTTDRTGYCAIGSVKPNIGHLDAAAGAAGVIKVALMMRHRTIVPSINYETPNPAIDFDSTPFRVATGLAPWLLDGVPRRAGVSSFGIGGTNAHTVLEEPPVRAPSGPSRPEQLLLLSAATPTALAQVTARLAAHLRRHPEVPLADVAHTLATGRAGHHHRRALLCRDTADAVRLLEDPLPAAQAGYTAPSVAFAFPGGDLDPEGRLAAEVAAAEPGFAERYEACAAAGPGGRAFAFPYALAGLWQDWGLHPEALFADGDGELVAAVLAGALRLEEALGALAEGITPPSGGTPRLPVLPLAEAGADSRRVVLAARAESPLIAVRDAWLAGADVDWARFYAGQRRHRVPLPTYPFEGRRYWLEAPARPSASTAGEAPAEAPPGDNATALPRLLPDPDRPDPFAQMAAFTGVEPYLTDHVIGGAPVLPAAVHLELGRAAAESVSGGRQTVTIRDADFQRMLSFPSGPRTVGVRLERHGDTALRYTVTASDGADEETYACGEVVLAETALPRPRPLDLAALRHRCESTVEPAACYGLLAERGVQHGPGLRALREFAHRAGEEALAVLDVPQAETGPDFAGPGTTVLHPALLDGALQAAVCLLAASGADGGAAHLPLRLGALHLYGALDGRCTAHVTRSAGAGGQVVRLDVTLAGEDGTIVAHLSDLVLRRVPATTEHAPVFLRGHWSPAPLAAGGTGSGPLLLLADGEGTREALGRALRDVGEHDTPVILVRPGSGFRRVDGRTYEADPARPGDFAELLAALTADGVPPRRILHAWTHAAQPSEGYGGDLLDLGVGSLFHLTKALLARRPVERTPLLFVHPESVPAHEAVAAFARTARLENPTLAYRAAGVAREDLAAQLPALLREFGAEGGREAEVRYEEGARLARGYQAVDPAAEAVGGPVLRDGGVYLITGGTGGLGLLVAEHLAARVRAHLYLVGRFEPDARARARIAALAASGGSARHLRADVSREDDVRTVLAAVEAGHGTLHGVVHSAGVLRDSFLLTKEQGDLWAVLAPKVQGTVHLDRLTARHPLDFFAAFSSVAAPLGNVGQADYAYANAFLDACMAVRQKLVAEGRRSGVSVSIGWPLWQEGGMRADAESTAVLERRLGSAALPTAVGLAAFETALGLGGGPLVVALGEPETVAAALSPAAGPAPRPEGPVPLAAPEPDLRRTAEDLLRAILATETGLDPAILDPETPLDRYGIDSILIVKLNSAVEKTFGETSKTLFFEYTTLADLAGYFAEQHAGRLRELADATRGEPAPGTAEAPVDVTADEHAAYPRASAEALVDGSPAPGAHPDDAIAVIGLSGRYPKAADLDEFWRNLEQGRDCVTEIPRDRWDHDRFFQDGSPVPGRAYAKWGGFLDDVDRFDPLFFGISPREAEVMDPQERLFLETAWHAVEDAGYRPADLAGSPVGVFVGAMYAEYQLYGADRVLRGEGPVPASLHASIANRVSYVLNLSGPSLAVDTMCSSSLTAIHLACRSLRDGESELAIAGGVNLSLHPHKYVYLSQGRFVSTDGRCRSFGAGGTGYVPGEGVGAVLLKPLRRALADRDHVHGVILGAAVNHGGRTNGYTVPSPNAQQRVIERALEQAGTDPHDIGYVEAHGTGTALGDPIEITGLRKAFGSFEEGRYCPIGSLKSNIGHLEAAAGVAGLTKVLLQFRHGRLVPSLHSAELNPNIDFAHSPLRVQRELTDWPRSSGPRRAALSSFGAGGSNAHLVLAEAPYAEPAPAVPAAGQRTPEPLLYVLSAQDEKRLREYAGRVGRFLRTAHVDLADVAHTLRCGREPMAERLAVVSADGAAVADALVAFAEGAPTPAWLWHGSAPEPGPKTGRAEAAAGQWLAGADPIGAAPVRADGRPPRRIPVPGYPFARERYWLGGLDEPAGTAVLHPLLDANESTLAETRFRTTLRRTSALLRDHEVAGRRPLAGTALLEMARAAVEQAAGEAPGGLRNVVWGRPVEVVDDSLDVYVALRPDGSEPGTVAFEVFSGDRVAHVRGVALTGPSAPAQGAVDLAGLRKRCAVSRTAAEVRRDYTRAGFRYGPSFDVLREVRTGTDEVLVEVRLPEGSPSAGFTLHPALLDGLLRAVHWLNRHTAPEPGDLVVPFSLGRIDILRPLPPVCFAHAVPAAGSGLRAAAVQRFDIVVVDEQGAELVRIRDFAGRVLPAADAPAPGEAPRFYAYDWEPRPADGPRAHAPGSALLVLADDPEPARLLARSGRWARVVRVEAGGRFHADGLDAYTIDPLDAGHYRRLLAELGDGGLDVVHLWDLDDDRREPIRLDTALNTGLFPVLHLLQAARGLEGGIRVVYGHGAPTGEPSPEREATAGLCRIAEAMPGSWLRTVRHDGGVPGAERLVRTLLDEFATPARTAQVRYDEDGRRLVRVVRSATPARAGTDAVPLKDRGVYLLTGGTGGIGLVFARYLAERHRARLVLLARSPLSGAARAEVERLTALGAEVLAVQGDVAVREDVQRALDRCTERFGRLDGVFHAAGVYDSAPVAEADRERFERVLAAKTHGTVNLDELTRDERLDLFVVFSSISSILGDFGAGSYSVANSFLDAYAVRREQWVREGRRHGRTLSLGWPLWTVGGVDSALGEAEVCQYSASTGIRPVTAEQGIEAFERAWEYGAPLLIPAGGDREVIERTLGVVPTTAAPIAQAPHAVSAGSVAPAEPAGAMAGLSRLRRRLLDHVRARLAEILKLPMGRLDSGATLDSYGLDSVLIMEANTLLGRDFPGLPGTLFFEYRTVGEVTDFLLREHPDAVTRLFGPQPEVAPAPDPAPTPDTAPGQALPSPVSRPRPVTAHVVPVPDPADEDIAIIGISGRYPKARDLDEFWENLRSGRDCVTEVPADRWDADALFDADPAAPGRSYSRWGGFLDDVDTFDSLFFRISPMQAKTMDPQERLFLETAWAALEDAGYPLDALPRPRFSAEGRDVGVFVGVMWGDYAVLAVEESFRGHHVTVPANRSSIANHVSHFGDFRGPSMVVDTACSSSLVALHLACESIRRGACAYAVAGGVNISAHPAKYVHLSRMNMLAKDGRCRSFGAGGTGYVPGEGVGAVLLKRLSQAEADGDSIHAVIKAGAVNQGGRTSGLTVPNPRAQQALVEEALARAGLDARTIGYVEAHGTGTELGDPIEHTALERAFRTHTEDVGFCALGSAKSAIGHLEGAAGIAGVTKAILQLRHGQFVPSLHADHLNPVIDFARSPFRVQRELADWARPQDGGPRRAAVSSFGVGGTNAHVILEEYLGAPDRSPTPDRPRAELLPLSARTEDRLRAHVAQLAAFLRRERDAGRAPALADVAHTLHAGRQAMAERLAVTVYDVDEAVETLDAFARGEPDHRVVRGGTRTNEALGDLLTSVREGRDLALALARSGDVDRLGRLWASGLALDPEVLQQVRPHRARRISLPTYPFTPERHWIARPDTAPGTAAAVEHPRAGTAPAPAVHSLDPADPVLRDHVVQGRSILPGVAHLDLALSAAPAAQRPRVLRDVRWLTPIVVDGGPVRLILRTEGDGFEIRGEDGAVLHSQGLLADAETLTADPDALSVEAVRTRCRTAVAGTELYRRLADRGLRYGPYFRAVDMVWTGAGEALARLALPTDHRDGAIRHALHPGVADAALHTVGALLAPDDGVLLPFAVERVELLRPAPADGWSHVSARGGHRYDVTLLDAAGRVCVRFLDLACRPVREPVRQEDGGYEQFGYRPHWIPAPAADGESSAGRRETVLVAAPESARTPALAYGQAHRDRGDEVRHLWPAEGAHAEGPAPGLIYFLGAADDVPAGGEARRAREEVAALHRLVRTLLQAHGRLDGVRLKVVTTDAFPLDADEESRPWAAGLWGYCSVLDKEFPALKVAYVDVRGAEAADAVARVIAEPFPVRAQAVSLRGGVRRARRLEPVELPPAGAGIRFRDHGVYLILGGLGTVGYDTALHLARTHRAKLVLMGRSEPGEQYRARLAELERAGGEALYLACDATDPAALKDAVARATRRFGPLHGAINSAMVLGATPVRDLDETALHEVLAAKADAGWNLARAVWDQPLDFLLQYSSGVSFAGNSGQAGYAAGCAVADALAHHLARTAPFPVRVLNWGYWHSGGDQEREAALGRLVAAGIRPIGAAEGMETVTRFLASGLSQLLATRASGTILEALGVDWDTRARVRPAQLPAHAVPPLRIDSADRAHIDGQRTASRALERLGRLLLLGAFQRAGLLRHTGERRSAAQLHRELRVVPGHDRLFEVLLDMLAQGGLVRRDGDEVVALAGVEDPEARQAAAEPEAARAALPAETPWTTAVADLLLRCTRELTRVLAGTTAATEVLFPDGSLDAVTAVYRGDPITDRLNSRLAAVVRAYVEERTGGVPVRILEIGAGTGSTSREVLAALAPFAGRVQYTYTDISAGFVRHGRKLFADAHPYADFRVLDIEGDLRAQGFAPDSYDIVFGTNVFHATRRIHRTLAQAKLLLRPNGLLLANEGTRADHVMALIFGLTDGWWAYEDPEHRIPGTPLLGERSWRDVLHDCGFQGVVTHGLPQDGEVAQSLIVAESDGVIVEADAVPPVAEPPVAEPPVAEPPVRAAEPAPAEASAEDRYAAAEEFVRQVFGRVLEMAPDLLDPDATFENYGVDSLVALQLNKALEQHVGGVPATLLFEQITIGRLARWLLAQRPEALSRVAPATAPDAPDPVREEPPAPEERTARPVTEAAPEGPAPAAGDGAELEQMVGALSDAQVADLLRLLDPRGRAAANGRVTAE
ncbi:type I polyketide synthase [Streptomyces coffeae]|uniref:SDR family NAD(P)-dependent oxidoreductase n=1 Tax=Streptomyces coffeae TaxID=621382 RepID=A0ABS1NLC0_9ACTN|nr:type I polyketide synthase [Streptomyces coffeae]MBL1100571.1 SDR family NAD(P)-dependent oxidoreductase [Streptomyces coffeae]